ncbi:MAG: hypothetical protein AB7P03_09745 [Kofleriaceae bacterium]
MIRRHLLAALAIGIEAGSDDAARAALRTIDWVLRGYALYKLERALFAAGAAINTPHPSDPELSRHLQRIAALAIAGETVPDLMDRERVAAAYRRVRVERLSRTPVLTIAVIMVALAAIAGGAMFVLGIPGRSNRVYARPLPPPASGAFKNGGVPLRDPAIERLLVDGLTTVVLEADRERQRGTLDIERRAHSDELARSPVINSLGPGMTAAWRDLLDGLERWAQIPMATRDVKEIAAELTARVRAVNDQLAGVGVGYYLDGDMFVQMGVPHAVIYVYRVEEVVFVLAEQRPIRVLSLRRLDQMELSRTAMGVQAAALGDPLVMLDPVDEHVAARVMPVLAPEAPFSLGDDEWRAAEGMPLALAAGRAIRGELMASLDTDGAAAANVAALLVERGHLMAQWRALLADRGLSMSRTDGLFLPEGLITNVDEVIPASQRQQARALEDAIARAEGPRIASRCQQIVVASVRRHEAQHGFDDLRSRPLRYPPQLETYLGSAAQPNGEPRGEVELARAELSAYLSQLINDPVTPHLSLWNAVSFAFDREHWHAPEAVISVVMIERLAFHLGVPAAGTVRLVNDHTVDRRQLEQLARPLSVATADQLRNAARAAWLDLYGDPPTQIVDR